MRLKGWENALNILALSNIASGLQAEAAMEGNRREMSQWWAERRMKDVFSTRSEQTGADGKDLPTPIISLNAIRRDDSATQDSGTGE